jgi:hypothetical protein
MRPDRQAPESFSILPSTAKAFFLAAGAEQRLTE